MKVYWYSINSVTTMVVTLPASVDNEHATRYHSTNMRSKMSTYITASASSSLTIPNCDHTFCSNTTTFPEQAIAVKPTQSNY